MDIFASITVLVGTLLMMSLWSYLYRETPFFHLGENTIVAISLGHAIVVSLDTLYRTAVLPASKGNFALMIPLLLGLTLFARLSRKYFWIGNFAMATVVGIGFGLSISRLAQLNILANISAAAPYFASVNLNNWLMGLVIISVLCYFTFTLTGTPGKVVGTVGRLGRLFFMLALGAGLGIVLQHRVGRIVAVELQVLVPIAPNTHPESLIAIGLALGAIVVDAVYRRYKELKERELKGIELKGKL